MLKTTLPIASIRTDGNTQPRDHINDTVATEYAEALRDGAKFPPVVTFHDGKDYWLADGFHRLLAYAYLDLTEIPAEVRRGGLRDALLFACGANATHGYRRSNDDKRHVVMRLLKDEEWSQWSSREIAKRCAVHHQMVEKLRGSLDDHPVTKSRTYKSKSGTEAVMKTDNIGGTSKPETESPSKSDKPEMVTYDPKTGKWHDPWKGPRRDENTRRQNLSMDIIYALEFLARAPVPPERAVKEFFMPVAHDVAPSLDAAVAWLDTFAKEWKDHERNLKSSRQAN